MYIVPTAENDLHGLGPQYVDPLDRRLLTTAGPIITSLTDCAGEPIMARRMRQAGPARLGTLLAAAGPWWHADDELLALEPRERLIARRVVLCDARSRTPFVLAETLVVADRLPDMIVERVLLADASLDQLLAAGHVDARRELFGVVAVRADESADHLDTRRGATLARRSSVIRLDGRPVAAVTDWLVPGRLTAIQSAKGRAIAG